MTRPRNRHPDALADELLADIAIVAEQAFRRGFQQGHEAATAGRALVCDVALWRYTDPALSLEILGGRRVRAIDRLLMQASWIVEKVRAAVRGAGATV